jgi:hypothetical protein
LIREILESWYGKTIVAAKRSLSGYVSSVTKGGGMLQVLYVIVVVALMAGFVDAFFFPLPDQSIIVYPNAAAQTIPEALIDFFIIAVGGAGIYLTILSGRQTTRPRTVNLYLGLALLLVAVSLFAGLGVTHCKLYGAC